MGRASALGEGFGILNRSPDPLVRRAGRGGRKKGKIQRYSAVVREEGGLNERGGGDYSVVREHDL